jgi:hypothetical protein
MAGHQHAPQGPKISAVGPILSESRVAWILAPSLQYDKVEEFPQLTICVCKMPIAEPRTYGGPLDDPSSVRPQTTFSILEIPFWSCSPKRQHSWPYSDALFQLLVFWEGTTLCSRPRCLH